MQISPTMQESACALFGEVIRRCPDILRADDALAIAQLMHRMLDRIEPNTVAKSYWVLTQLVMGVPGWLDADFALLLMHTAMDTVVSASKSEVMSGAVRLWVATTAHVLHHNILRQCAAMELPHIRHGIVRLGSLIGSFSPQENDDDDDEEARTVCVNVLRMLSHFPRMFLPDNTAAQVRSYARRDELWANLLHFIIAVVQHCNNAVADENLQDALHSYFFTVKKECRSRWSDLFRMPLGHAVFTLHTAPGTFMERWAVPRSWDRDVHRFFPDPVRSEILTLVAIYTHFPERALPPELMELLYHAVAHASVCA